MKPKDFVKKTYKMNNICISALPIASSCTSALLYPFGSGTKLHKKIGKALSPPIDFFYRSYQTFDEAVHRNETISFVLRSTTNAAYDLHEPAGML